MSNLIEKSFLLGLGVLSVGKDAAEKLVKEAIAKADLTPEEGKSFLDKYEAEGKKLEEKLEAKVNEILKTKGESLLPCYEKLQALEKRVAELEAKLAK